MQLKSVRRTGTILADLSLVRIAAINVIGAGPSARRRAGLIGRHFTAFEFTHFINFQRIENRTIQLFESILFSFHEI